MQPSEALAQILERIPMSPAGDDAPKVSPEHIERAAIAKRIMANGPAVPWARLGDEQFERCCAPELRAAVAWWRWERGGMLLIGPTGCGKTLATCALKRKLLSDGIKHGGRAWAKARRIGWLPATALSRARREHELGHGEAPLIEYALRYSLLIVDELGFLDDPRDNAIAEVICGRDYRNLPTIVTSGMTAEELEKRYGTATIRKICERGRVVNCHPSAGDAR